MVVHSTDINKMNNHVWSQTIEHKKVTTYDIVSPGPGLEQAQTCGRIKYWLVSCYSVFAYMFLFSFLVPSLFLFCDAWHILKPRVCISSIKFPCCPPRGFSKYIYIYIFDRLRSEYGLKSASTPQIGIHCRHYLKSRSDLRVFSNRCPFQILRSMADLLVMVRAYVSDVIGPRFEKVRNGHRFENWTPITGACYDLFPLSTRGF